MKNTLKSYMFTFIFVLLSTFIFSLILTLLKQNELLTYNVSNVVTTILSLSIFFVAGLLLGIKQKSKGLLNGIVLSILFVCINLIMGFNLNNIKDIVKFISKIFLILLGTLIGVNLKRD